GDGRGWSDCRAELSIRLRMRRQRLVLRGAVRPAFTRERDDNLGAVALARERVGGVAVKLSPEDQIYKPHAEAELARPPRRPGGFFPASQASTSCRAGPG